MVSMCRPRLPAPLGTERRDDGAGSDRHCSIGGVKRFVDWIAGAVGGIALYRLLQRWRGEELEPWPEPATAEEPDERAEELRAKLAETRAAEEESAPAEPVPPETLDDRRRRVHEEGRAAIDEMRGE